MNLKSVRHPERSEGSPGRFFALLRMTSVIVLLLILTACNEVAIVHDLTERDANEILVVLARHEIAATKEKAEKNQEVTWTVNVAQADALSARDILVANNLPKIRQGGLSAICKDSGLILTPKTEKCREILAYKGEIINSLESIPGVVSADVVLNLPDKEDFPDDNSPQMRPTASVTVQYLDNGTSTTPLTEGKVQEFVANAVSGLDARDVAVIITLSKPVLEKTPPVKTQDTATQTTTTTGNTVDSSATDAQTDVTDESSDSDADSANLVSIGGLEMDATSAKRFKIIAVAFVVLLLVIAVAFIVILLRMARLRRKAAPQAASAEAGAEDQKLLGGG